MPVEKRRTPKERIYKVVGDLNSFYPKFAVQRSAPRIAEVLRAADREDPEASKMLDDLLAQLKKAKEAKVKDSDLPDVPSDYGWEKTPEEITAEERAAKRTGQTETVAVTGTVVDAPATGAIPVGTAAPATQRRTNT